MRTLVVSALLVFVSMLAVAGEPPKEPTIDEKIANLEKMLKSGQRDLAEHEAKIKAAKEAGKPPLSYRFNEQQAENFRRMIALRQADLTALKREKAAADPKGTAEINYREAKGMVETLEKQLAEAKERLKQAEADLVKAGGKVPDQPEPK